MLEAGPGLRPAAAPRHAEVGGDPGPADGLRRLPLPPGGVGGQPRQLGHLGVAGHAGGGGLDRLLRPAEGDPGVGRPAHRPRPLLVPAAQRPAALEGDDRLLVPAEVGEAVAEVVPPARVVRVGGSVPLEDRHVALELAAVAGVVLPRLVEDGAGQAAAPAVVDERLVGRADELAAGRQPEEALLLVGLADVGDHQGVVRGGGQRRPDVGAAPVDPLVGVEGHRPVVAEPGGGGKGGVARRREVVDPREALDDQLRPRHLARHLERPVGDPGVEQQAGVDPVDDGAQRVADDRLVVAGEGGRDDARPQDGEGRVAEPRVGRGRLLVLRPAILLVLRPVLRRGPLLDRDAVRLGRQQQRADPRQRHGRQPRLAVPLAEGDDRLLAPDRQPGRELDPAGAEHERPRAAGQLPLRVEPDEPVEVDADAVVEVRRLVHEAEVAAVERDRLRAAPEPLGHARAGPLDDDLGRRLAEGRPQHGRRLAEVDEGRLRRADDRHPVLLVPAGRAQQSRLAQGRAVEPGQQLLAPAVGVLLAGGGDDGPAAAVGEQAKVLQPGDREVEGPGGRLAVVDQLDPGHAQVAVERDQPVDGPEDAVGFDHRVVELRGDGVVGRAEHHPEAVAGRVGAEARVEPRPARLDRHLDRPQRGVRHQLGQRPGVEDGVAGRVHAVLRRHAGEGEHPVARGLPGGEVAGVEGVDRLLEDRPPHDLPGHRTPAASVRRRPPVRAGAGRIAERGGGAWRRAGGPAGPGRWPASGSRLPRPRRGPPELPRPQPPACPRAADSAPETSPSQPSPRGANMGEGSALPRAPAAGRFPAGLCRRQGGPAERGTTRAGRPSRGGRPCGVAGSRRR